MPGVTGREVKIAFAKFGANSWGVAASVTRGAYFQSDGGLKFEPAILQDDAFGQTFTGASDVGDVAAPNVTLSQQARYNDHSYIWEALAMGSPAAVTISTSASGQTTSWRHQIDLAASIDGLGLTLAVDKQRYVEELTSAKVWGWDLEVGDGGVMRQSFRVIGSKITVQSSVNINSTVAGATFPALNNRITRAQGVLRMNVNSGGSLVAADAVPYETVKWSFTRPQDAPFVGGQDYVAEPADNGFPTFMLEVQYPRMTTPSANSLFAGLRDAQAFKGDLTFSGSYINSTDRHGLLYQWPYLQLTNFEAPTAGANQVKPKAMFAARLAPSSPSGMAFINPVRIVRTTINSTVAF